MSKLLSYDLDFLRSALARATDPASDQRLSRRAGAMLTFDPAYSKVRVLADLNPATSTGSIFGNTTYGTDQAQDLRAFDYKKGSSAASGGYGANTTATIRHTNLTTERECPDGGEQLVVGFHLKADQLKTPITTTDKNTATDDSDNKQNPVPDGFRGHQLRAWILRQFSDAYVGYWQIADGKRFYQKVNFDDSGEAVVLMADGIPWRREGQLVYGFERKLDMRLPAYQNDFAGIFGYVGGAMGLTLDASAPADGEILANVDLTVSTIGPRTVVVTG